MTDVGPKSLTKKQRYWLKHLRACESSGQVLASYAVSHDLGVRQLYSWKTRLRRMGLLGGSVSPRMSEVKRGSAPVDRTSGKRPAKLGFTAVRIAAREESVFDLRIRFPNGILLELGGGVRSVPDAEFLRLLAALP